MTKKPFLILIPMLLLIGIVSIEYTGISIILPAVSESLHLNLSQIKWCGIGYLLFFSAFIVVAGQAGDRFGNKSVLYTGIFLFAFSSFLAAVSNNGFCLVFARCIQGFGAAAIWPNATAIAFKCMPSDKKSLAIGLVTGIVGFSMALGPLLAGVLSSFLSWRWFFIINLPVVSLVLALTFKTKIEVPVNSKKLDIFGMLMLTTALMMLAVGFNFVGLSVLEIASFLLFFSFSLMIFKFFLSYEKSIKNPFCDIAIFQNRIFIMGCVLRALSNFSFYTFIFVMGLYLMSNLGYSSFMSGVLFLPMTISIGILSSISSVVINKYGIKKALVSGFLLFSVGYYLSSFSQEVSIYTLMAIFTLPGFGYALTSSGLLNITMSTLSSSQLGIASGIFYMFSLLASSIGISFATIIMKLNTSSSIIKDAVSLSFTEIMFFCCAMSLVGSVVSYVFLKTKKGCLLTNSGVRL